MSRDPRYQKLLNSKRWQEVKAIVWRRAEGLCERCKAEGVLTSSLTTKLDCHHIIPVQRGRTIEEMKLLCFDVNNIQLLCRNCHMTVHKQMGSNKKTEVKANRQRAFERWIEHLNNKFTNGENETGTIETD